MKTDRRRRQLSGLRVAITRPAHLASGLVDALEAEGARALVTPCIQINPPQDRRGLDEALARIDDYDWLVFASVNAVDALANAKQGWRPDPSRARAAAVGPATKHRLQQLWGEGAPIVVGQTSTARGLFEALRGSASLKGARILIPRADIAPESLARWLEAEGARVDSAVAYQTVGNLPGAQRLVAFISGRMVDVVTFTSGSTVRCFAEVMKPTDRHLFHCASIGPQTSKALRQVGIHPDSEARDQSVSGLVAAIVASLGDKRDSR